MVCGIYLKISYLGGSFSTVRATVIQWNMERDMKWNAELCMVLAEDPKHLVYYVVSKLNKVHLAGDPKRKGWGIHLQVQANIQSHGYKK